MKTYICTAKGDIIAKDKTNHSSLIFAESEYGKFIVVGYGFIKNQRKKYFDREIHYLMNLAELSTMPFRLDLVSMNIYQEFGSIDQFNEIRNKALVNYSQGNDSGMSDHWVSYTVYRYVRHYAKNRFGKSNLNLNYEFEPFLESIDTEVFPLALRHIDCPMYVKIACPQELWDTMRSNYQYLCRIFE